MGILRITMFFCAVIAMTSGCATSAGPRRVNPIQENAAKSIPNTSKTPIEFVNDSGQVVHIFWLDFEGRRKLYRTLKIGESYEQQTYLDHAWLVTNAGNDAWYIFSPMHSRESCIFKDRLRPSRTDPYPLQHPAD